MTIWNIVTWLLAGYAALHAAYWVYCYVREHWGTDLFGTSPWRHVPLSIPAAVVLAISAGVWDYFGPDWKAAKDPYCMTMNKVANEAREGTKAVCKIDPDLCDGDSQKSPPTLCEQIDKPLGR